MWALRFISQPTWTGFPALSYEKICQ
jgi:hypothetical protein